MSALWRCHRSSIDLLTFSSSLKHKQDRSRQRRSPRHQNGVQGECHNDHHLLSIMELLMCAFWVWWHWTTLPTFNDLMWFYLFDVGFLYSCTLVICELFWVGFKAPSLQLDVFSVSKQKLSSKVPIALGLDSWVNASGNIVSHPLANKQRLTLMNHIS